MNRTIAVWALLLAAAPLACKKDGAGPPNAAPLPTDGPPIAEDTSPKSPPRLMPAEVYLRSYQSYFGVQTLNDAAVAAQAAPNSYGSLFSSWDSYLGVIGLPDPENDRPRATESNTLMQSAFDRLGTALCSAAVLSELSGNVPMSQRHVFVFDLPTTTGDLSLSDFTPRFDVLHRVFLGYPAALAPEDRTSVYFALYTRVVARNEGNKLTAVQAGWANVCQGLVRHPEFQLY